MLFRRSACGFPRLRGDPENLDGIGDASYDARKSSLFVNLSILFRFSRGRDDNRGVWLAQTPPLLRNGQHLLHGPVQDKT